MLLFSLVGLTGWQALGGGAEKSWCSMRLGRRAHKGAGVHLSSRHSTLLSWNRHPTCTLLVNVHPGGPPLPRKGRDRTARPAQAVALSESRQLGLRLALLSSEMHKGMCVEWPQIFCSPFSFYYGNSHKIYTNTKGDEIVL